MKKPLIYIILVSFLFIYLDNANSQPWMQQNSNTTNRLNSVSPRMHGLAWICGDSGTVLKTSDGGYNWNRDSILFGSLRDIFFVNSQTGFITADAGTLYKTTNGGLNWSGFHYYPLLNVGLEKIWFLNVNTGIATGSNGFICRTSNGGVNWTKVDSAEHLTYYKDICFVNSFTGFVIGYDSTIKRTTDTGITWQRIYTGINRLYTSIAFKNSTTGFIGCEDNTLLKTTNRGINWVAYSIPSDFNLKISDIGFGSEENGMLTASGMNTSRVYYTSNGGNNWATSQCITEDGLYIVRAVDSLKYVLAGSYGKIIYTLNLGITGIKKQNNTKLHSNYFLNQNYPNPFNPVTNIRFDLPKNDFVTLKVFDILGREVTTLVNEKLSAGSYETKWDGSNYPSGVYFYKLVTGGYSYVKKMVFIK